MTLASCFPLSTEGEDELGFASQEFNHVLENENNMFAVMPGNLVIRFFEIRFEIRFGDKVLCYYGINSKECTAMKDGDHKNIDSQLLII